MGKTKRDKEEVSVADAVAEAAEEQEQEVAGVDKEQEQGQEVAGAVAEATDKEQEQEVAGAVAVDKEQEQKQEVAGAEEVAGLTLHEFCKGLEKNAVNKFALKFMTVKCQLAKIPENEKKTNEEWEKLYLDFLK
jgi:hypothetical protein